MIDLHCHILPGIDDGASELEKSVQMATIAVADGIRQVACTPHIYPAVFDNTAAGIEAAAAALQTELDARDIPLDLLVGADVHLVPEVLPGLREGRIPTLNNSRYFLLEPSHHVRPARFAESVFYLLAAGYVPIITHPERLSWAGEHYADFVQLVEGGAWLQLTAGSLTGRFGKPVRRLAKKMLKDGLVHLLATDAHGVNARPPLLAEGRDLAARWLGDEEAERLVAGRPAGIVADLPAAEQPPPPGLAPARSGSIWQRLFG